MQPKPTRIVVSKTTRTNTWSEDPQYILDLLKRLPTPKETENKSVYTSSFFGGESIAAEDEPIGR